LRRQVPTGVDLVGFRQRLDTLRRERRHYHDLFDRAPDAHLLTDAEGVVCEANQAALQLLNVPRGELAGKPLVVYLAGGERRRLHDRITAMHRGEAVPEWDTLVAPRDLPDRHVAMRCLPDCDPAGGTLRGIHWLLRDTEGRHRGGGDASPEELDPWDLRREAQRLAALDKVKSDFLDLVSHELRSPIGVARGYVSMLSDGTLGDLSPRATSVLPVVLGKLDEMSRLVDQMLDTARLDDTGMHLDVRPVDVRGVVEEAAMSARRSDRHTLLVECGEEAVV
jgi:signal transduction histidine kinase